MLEGGMTMRIDYKNEEVTVGTEEDSQAWIMIAMKYEWRYGDDDDDDAWLVLAKWSDRLCYDGLS